MPISQNKLVVFVVPSWLKKCFCASAPQRETFLCAVLLANIALSAVSAENWDRFRGPNGSGQSEDDSIPALWEPENFLWKQPLNSVGHGSPVVWENRLFLTSAAPASGAQLVFAFDAHTGVQLWQKQFEVPLYHINTRNSYASSTPAVDAEHLYVMWLENDHITLVALKHDGSEVWRRDVGPYEEVHGFGKSPMVVDDLVCVANDSDAESAVVAFDRNSGEVRWKLPRKSGTTSFGTPCVLDPTAKDKQLITSCTASGLTAIDITTGKAVWQAFEDDLTARCVSSPIVANGMIFVACGEGGSGKVLIAARPSANNSPPQEIYRLTKSVPQVPTVVANGDLLFLWHDRGIVTCCDLATGKQIWRERVGGDFHSSPVRAGKKIFCCSRQGDVVVLAADKEYKLLARNSLKETCVATPAVAHHRLYVRTDATLYCIGQPNSK